MEKKIFISHAVRDKPIADALVDLLETGLGVRSEDIFCSSLEGLGIPPGRNFVEFIRERLAGTDLVIALLTKNYYTSRFCIAELGASWVLSHDLIPMIFPPLNFSDIGDVLTGIQLTSSTDKSALNQFYSELCARLEINGKSYSRWEVKRDVFIDTVGKVGKSDSDIKSIPTISTKSKEGVKVSVERLTYLCALERNIRAVAGFSGNIFIAEGENEIVNTAVVSVDSEAIRCICKTGKGKSILVAGDSGRVYYLDRANNPSQVATCPSSVYEIAGTDQHFYTAERSGVVTEWELGSKQTKATRLRILHKHSTAAFSVAVDSGAEYCISGAADGSLSKVNLRTGTTYTATPTNDAIFCLGCAANLVFAGTSAGELVCLDSDFKETSRWIGHTDALRSLSVSPAGRWVITASKDRTLRVWEHRTGKSWVIARSVDYFYGVRISLDCTRIEACDGAGKLFIVEFGKNIDEMSQNEMNEVVKNA